MCKRMHNLPTFAPIICNELPTLRLTCKPKTNSMNKLAAYTISIITALGIPAAYAQEKPQVKTLLWEVSGNGLIKPSYLYGTYHILCSPNFSIKPRVERSLAKSEVLVLEIDVTNPTEMAKMQQLLVGKEPLSASLTPEEQKRMDEALQKYYGFTLKQVDSFTPATIAALMAQKTIKCTDTKVPEIELAKLVKQQGKSIGSLETIEEQVEVLNSTISAKELVAQLESTNEYQSFSDSLVASYINEDLDELFGMLKGSKYMDSQQEEKLLIARNRNWTAKLPKMMERSSLFIAVGAAHLAGNDGLIALLRKQGYTINPILN